MMIDDESLAKIQNPDKHRDFCEYFNELDKEGIGYSVGDMYRKAHELGIAPPNAEELFKWLDKHEV